ncbi:cytochrome b/b6 domain-containing protein [Notoacmeibacter sp. MSK16QG-6]|uniref:cytochrome b/b6 domain-containing protein n=1 Tax=Notoacmeibacter sp. MSK16QG-6 TaxID=2957982 RepID=UPI00209CE2DB|nr:cytochrome b/b6 domain-containing protein [Notoacmeibacter sp. MSK16QG-6]MCP1198165.1 cytochrome b/b6 domain-containing protein [Notoacmeibacter sp. MSK16QG-6]
MRVFNTIERYGVVAALLHWAIAFLILTLLPLGIYMHELPQVSGEEVAQKIWLYSLHKTLGVMVLALAILRVIWAILNRRPAPLHPERRAETFLAETVHWALYAAILATPLAGWFYHAATEGFAPIWWPFGQNLPFIPSDDAELSKIFKSVHAGLAITMIGLVGLHIVGALKHLVIDRDGTLARMVPGWRMGSESEARARLSAERGHNHAPAFLAGLAVLAVAAGLIYGIESSEDHRDTAAAVSEKVPVAPSASTAGENAVDAAHGAEEGTIAADAAPLWVVDQDASKLAIAVDQNGSPTEGVFEDWAATIRFDPEALDKSSVRVEVAVGSLSMGDVSSTATGLLKAGEQPTAIWTADSFSKTSDNTYEAAGTLELAGQTAPLMLPFTLDIDGDTARMSAQTVMQRLDWSVGAGDYPDGGTVGLDVTLQIEVVATRETGN